MVFKRRNRRSGLEWAREFVYPTGGFRRAAQYVTHRLRRLPDEPHRIARGVFAGVFVSFTPLFGVHMLAAALMAWVMRGNILAAVLATFLGNPLTTPIIAITSVELGQFLLGIDVPMDLRSIFQAFGNAGGELWSNFLAIFGPEPTHWENLGRFMRTIYIPYFTGGILPGIAVSLIFYWITIPIVRAYQTIRANKTRERVEKRQAARALRASADLGDAPGPQGADDAPNAG